VGEVELKSGYMSFWHGVTITDQHFGPVHLGVARPIGSEAYWYIISDEAAELKMFEEYGLRFDMVCASILKRIFWRINRMDFSWKTQ
jgi:hypothetical protein